MQARLAAWIVTAASRLRRDEGQAMVEYALIIAVISIAALASFTPLHDAIANAFDSVVKAF